MKRENIQYFVYWCAIFTVAISMTIYALVKPFQFSKPDISQIKETVTGHQIMWMFYGYSKSYILIIGLLELIGAICLLFQKTRLFACFLLTTILTNIILQNFFYEISALKITILYQLLILVILYFDRLKLKKLLITLFTPTKHPYKNYFLLGFAIIVAILFVLFETRIMNLI